MSKITSLEELETFDLGAALSRTFQTAMETNNLVYTPATSQRHKDEATGMDYELMIVEGLAKRPINRPSVPGSDATVSAESLIDVKAKNPFMKPEPELTIVEELCGDYRLLLNKFPNTEEHFLLVTREFVQQDTLLKPIELQLTQAILRNINAGKGANDARFFAFFNSGPESGYSQFHKHIQFMKLPAGFPVYQSRLVGSSEFFMPTDTKVSKPPVFNKNLTFKHSILKLPEGESVSDEETGHTLAMLYMYLFRRVLNIFKENEIELSKVSYNFLMMEDWMMIVPRRRAVYNGIWQNSLGFMGLFSVKDEEVKKNLLENGIGAILRECGFEIEDEEEKIVYNEYGY